MTIFIWIIINIQLLLCLISIVVSICYHCKYTINSSKYYQSTKNIDKVVLDNKICPICLEGFDSKNPKVYKFKVCSGYKHPFHKKCICKYIKHNSHLIQSKKCPVCRIILKKREIITTIV